MGTGEYDTQAEKDFNKHHGGSMYGDHMGNLADKDTIEFDDEEKKNPGKVEPYNPKDDKVKRGYEPANSPHLKEESNPCWSGFTMVGMKDKNGKKVPNCVPNSQTTRTKSEGADSAAIGQPGGYYGDTYDEIDEYDVETIAEEKDFIKFMREFNQQLSEAGCPCVYEAEYQGREVQLGKPTQGDVKKFKVYVKNDKGNVVKVNFGQKGMVIKKDNPERRKSFRARMHCDNPGPRDKANYWSCRKW